MDQKMRKKQKKCCGWRGKKESEEFWLRPIIMWIDPVILQNAVSQLIGKCAVWQKVCTRRCGFFSEMRFFTVQG